MRLCTFSTSLPTGVARGLDERRRRGPRLVGLPALLLLFAGCVDVTPPWKRAAEYEAGIGPGGTSAGGATASDVGGSGGTAGVEDAFPPADTPLQGGAGGNADVPPTVVDGPPAGGATGSLDAPLVETEAGSRGGTDGGAGAGGTGGGTIDAHIDTPLGGAGGMGRDGSLDGNLDGKGGTGGSGTGGRSGSGGSGTAGSGTGGRGTGGAGSGGATRTGGTTGTGGVVGTGGATGVVMAGLVAYYPCDQTAGPTLTDVSGNARHASLVTGTGGSGGYTFGPGKVNNALYLVPGNQGHAALPKAVLNGQKEMTIATWVYLNAGIDWQRVWDFGDDTSVYMFLTPRRGTPKNLRFAITTTGNTNEQGLDDDVELPVNEWHHVAVVLGGGGGFLYLDGSLVDSDPAIALRPADLGNTANNYIGKSQWDDPYLDGRIDEFRVYNRALSAAEILTLFNWTGS